jgi:hypothetical protein
VLVLDMIEIINPLGADKYDTWRILLVKCYIDNFVHLRSCIRTLTSISSAVAKEEASIFYLTIDYTG